jgi:hypothetical protein
VTHTSIRARRCGSARSYDLHFSACGLPNNSLLSESGIPRIVNVSLKWFVTRSPPRTSEVNRCRTSIFARNPVPIVRRLRLLFRSEIGMNQPAEARTGGEVSRAYEPRRRGRGALRCQPITA